MFVTVKNPEVCVVWCEFCIGYLSLPFPYLNAMIRSPPAYSRKKEASEHDMKRCYIKHFLLVKNKVPEVRQYKFQDNAQQMS